MIKASEKKEKKEREREREYLIKLQTRSNVSLKSKRPFGRTGRPNSLISCLVWGKL